MRLNPSAQKAKWKKRRRSSSSSSAPMRARPRSQRHWRMSGSRALGGNPNRARLMAGVCGLTTCTPGSWVGGGCSDLAEEGAIAYPPGVRDRDQAVFEVSSSEKLVGRCRTTLKRVVVVEHDEATRHYQVIQVLETA